MNVSAIKAQITQCRDPIAVRAVLEHARSHYHQLTDVERQQKVQAAWLSACQWGVGRKVYRWSESDDPSYLPRGSAALVEEISQRMQRVKLNFGNPQSGVWFDATGLMVMDWRPVPPPADPQAALDLGDADAATHRQHSARPSPDGTDPKAD